MTLSPDHGIVKYLFPNGSCIYKPTCSEYTYEAIEKFGILRGTWIGAKRIGRCHPWATPGIDPVSDKKS